MNKTHFRHFLGCVFAMGAGIWLTSCSAAKTNMVSVSYHNATARYNAFFIARERIREIESSIIASQDNNYDDVLIVLPPLDSSISVTYSSQIEDCIRKASLVIQNHPNSKWVDDAYNLIGKARLYGHEYTHAIETCKYVNTNSKDDDARHFALVNLMRTFIAYGEMNNAMAVSDVLAKEELSRNNLKNLYLTRAYYYQLMEDYNNMVNNLVEVTPLLTRKDNKPRIYFIIGQVYQKTGFESEAFNNYRKCLANNPEYELSFYSRLFMARVTQLDQKRDIKNIRKDLRKLVRDAKNKEFVDRIYYEWADFEIRNDNLDEGIDKYNLSIRNSLNNPRQKGRSYLKLGEIYYETLRNYELAKAYYDSTIQVLPGDYTGYDDIKSRQRVLDDFVAQLSTIQTQDSLLALSEMDSISLIAYIDNVIAEREALRAAEEEKKAKRQGSQSRYVSLFESSGILSSSSNWYFNNPSAIAIGNSEFLKVWGNRPLEDHWRRSVKNQQAFAQESTQTGTEKKKGTEGIIDEEESTNYPEVIGREEMYVSVPRTQAEKEHSLSLIEQAYFKLGNIYNFDLKEEHNAVRTFTTLLDRFPQTSNKPEVLYQLYLLQVGEDPTRAEMHKQELIESFPETTFAKLLINPNYQEESRAVNEVLKKEYEYAYSLFEQGDYTAANQILSGSINQYHDGIFIPNLRLLQILIVGKTENLAEYQLQLGHFLEEFPDSDVTGYARTLLDASERYKEGLIKLKEAEFTVASGMEHYFILVYGPESGGGDVLLTKIEDFNTNYFLDKGLKTGTLRLDASNDVIVVDRFGNQNDALYYYDMFAAEQTIDSESANIKFHNFVITKENFDILYKTKELNTYRSFYSLHY